MIDNIDDAFDSNDDEEEKDSSDVYDALSEDENYWSSRKTLDNARDVLASQEEEEEDED
jgi:hypothetical protein